MHPLVARIAGRISFPASLAVGVAGRSRKLTAAILIVSVAGLAAGCGAADRPAAVSVSMYVDAASGSDSNPCTLGAPCLTIQRALDLVPDKGRVLIGPGEYAGGFSIARDGVTVGGRSGEQTPVVVIPDGGVFGVNNVEVAASDVTLQHLKLRKTDKDSEIGVIATRNTSDPAAVAGSYRNLTINNLEVTGGVFGAAVSSDGLIVTSSRWLGQARHSIWIQSAQTRVEIASNRFEGKDGDAVAVSPVLPKAPLSGAFEIRENTSVGKAGFFYYDQGNGHSPGAVISIDLARNYAAGTSGDAIVLTGTPGADPASGPTVASFTATANRLAGAKGRFAIRNDLSSAQAPAVAAPNNWYGCNDGPTANGCSKVSGSVDAAPWLVMKLAAPEIVGVGTKPNATASINQNSAGESLPRTAWPLSGGEVNFSLPGGAVISPIPVTNGSAVTPLLVGATGPATISAQLDNEVVSHVFEAVDTAPTEPRNVRVTTPADGTIQGAWDPPSYEGIAPITSYVMSVYPTAPLTFAPSGNCSSRPTVTTCAVSGLQPNTEYYANVIAYNSVTSGVASAAQYVTTTGKGRPNG